MKTRVLLLVFLLSSVSLFAQKQVETFDGRWTNLQDLWWSEGSALKLFAYDSTFKYEGAAALKIEWLNKTYVDWQYAGVSMANYLDPQSTINIGTYDSLVFNYYIERPAKSNDTYLALIFMDNPSDVSFAADPTGNNMSTELWRHQVNNIFTDTSKTWKRVSIPLKMVGDPENPTPDDWGQGWNRQTLGKINNMRFDLAYLRGYYLEFDSDSTATYDSCVVYFDNMIAVGRHVAPLVLFNGRRVPSDVSMATGWSGSVAIDPVEDFDNRGTGAVKWVCDDGWDGVWWNLSSPKNLGPSWTEDTVQFAIKAPKGFGTLYVALTDPQTTTPSAYQVVYTMPEDSAVAGGYDGQWHLIKLPLSKFEQWGSWDPAHDKSKRMDSSQVAQLRIEGDGQNMDGIVVYFDNVWTDHPAFDITAPAAPTGVVAVANGPGVNTVSWTDNPQETMELYNVYQSIAPFTDVHASGVSVAKLAVAKGVGIFDIPLRVPVQDKSVDFYYAVTCVDSMGNESLPALSSKVTNTAKGVTVISPTAPPSFVVDGDLSEWSGIAQFRMNPQDHSGTVVYNTKITDSLDLNVKAWVALDNTYLYVAFDVTDNFVVVDTTLTPGWVNDSPELFIGFYDDSKGIFRWFYERGAEPNYHLRFCKNEIRMMQYLMFDKAIMTPGTEYVWKEKNLFPGYTVEARIPLALLASEGGDQLFTPQFGMQMPIDFAINDADVVGTREGILTYSPTNEDNSWAYVTGYWTSTWLGGYPTSVKQTEGVPLAYSLSQNYPNPFNPSTTIAYTLQKAGMVTLKVYDILGREVATLVHENQNAGSYVVRLDMPMGMNLATGVYFYRIESGTFRDVKKMMLLK
jgi:hypothetical protein